MCVMLEVTLHFTNCQTSSVIRSALPSMLTVIVLERLRVLYHECMNYKVKMYNDIVKFVLNLNNFAILYTT